LLELATLCRLVKLLPQLRRLIVFISQIEEGDIKIPAFQRGFVWSREQVIELLDSFYHNYPVGSVLLWSSNERLKASRDIAGLRLPEREPDYPVNNVLDGQQRLSTLFAVFCGHRLPRDDSSTYAINPDIFDLSFRFDDESFVCLTCPRVINQG